MEARAQFSQSRTFPAELPPHADIASCAGGEKCTPNSSVRPKWEAAGISMPQGPTYFVYETERVDDATYVLRARADFDQGGKVHTQEVRLQKGEGDCTLEAAPMMTLNEFE